MKTGLRNGRPVAEYFQAFGLAGLQGFFQIKHALVADFLCEIHIDVSHFVFEDKPTGLADEIAVVASQDSADRQRSFQ